MTDLTQGSLRRHLWTMTVPMMIGMFVQSLYLFVDLYFVAGLGADAVAAVSAAGNLMLLIMAFTQMLNVGCVALIARYTGAADPQSANVVFQQAMLMGAALALLTLVLGFGFSGVYMQLLSSDAAVQHHAGQFLLAYLPGLALMFVSTAIAAALRAVGIVKPAMQVQLISVLLNMLLAPVLIAGWGTGYPLGVLGAGLASSISVALAVLLLWRYFLKSDHSVLQVPQQWRLNGKVWRQIVAIGLPAGGEFALIFVFTAFVYWVIQDFGTATQAAFGIGNRILQAVTMPAIAFSFALPAIVGQNYGAGFTVRVQQSFRVALQQLGWVMVLLFMLCQLLATELMVLFSTDPAVQAQGVLFIRIISLNCLSAVLVFSCSGMFQGLGNTWPALASSALRILLFMLPVLLLSGRADFSAAMVWYCSAASVLLQGLCSYYLLRWQLRRKFQPQLAGL
ncbi:MATE family efflux transporter [Rheinheimera sp. 4Y26]|uniref:MATE family efflux transporter n=1 Tax=Rheinheimera sp. 4Y26 TaxID=2977811 RepID=UPI0021B14A9C|nr:MATE family efflux transporter [Rheinheimera sp. 4Y26]MCT6698057.1 MATE family efflux transporter [Rheinheimera sp. 4Y26]